MIAGSVPIDEFEDRLCKFESQFFSAPHQAEITLFMELVFTRLPRTCIHFFASSLFGFTDWLFGFTDWLSVANASASG
jgi:hypothetical protein